MDARRTPVEELGFWSSHPDAMRKSRRVLFWIGLLPMAALLGFAVVVCSGGVSVKTLLLHPTFCVKAMAIAGCATFGAVFTLCLLAVLSTCQVRKGSVVKDRIPFPYWMIGLASVAWLLPLALSWFRNYIWDAPYLGLAEVVLNLLCFAPFFWICIWLRLVRGRAELPKNARHPVLPLVIGCLALAASCLPFFTDVRGGLVSLFPHSSLVKSLHVSLLRLFSFALLFPIGMMFVCLWKMLWAEGKPKKNAAKRGDGIQQEGGDEEDATPDAVLVLQQEGFLPAGLRWTDPVAKRSLDELGEMAVGKSLDKCAVNCATFAPLVGKGGAECILFGAHVPTSDQVSFLRDFRSLHDDRVRRRIAGETGGRSQDMFLLGHEGSGRTEVLCAAAVQTALLRGENVVYFVAGTVEARSVLHRIRSATNRLLLGEYVTVDILRRGDGLKWSRGDVSSPAPGIIIAEPRDFEREFFSNPAFSSLEMFEGAATVLMAISTVIVDDFLEYSMPMRAHLTFIVRKLRMLQAGNCHPLQAVVCSRPIARPEKIYDYFSPDLTTQAKEENDMRLNVHFIRPRDPGRFWCGTLTLDAGQELGKTVGALVQRCVENGRKVLFYSKHATESEIRRSLAGAVASSESIHFISKIDALSQAMDADGNCFSPDVVLYLSMTCAESSAALRLSLPSGEPVFIRIVSEGEPAVREPELYPLLPDEMASALKMRHLRTLLPFLPPHMPIPESDWAFFGISANGRVARKSELGDSTLQRGVVCWSCDQLEDAYYSPKTVPPYLVLETDMSSGVDSAGVDCDEFPDAVESLWHDVSDPADEKLFLAAMDPEGAKPREHTVKWMYGNQFVGETDISHSDVLRLQIDGVTYVRDSVTVFYERDVLGCLKVSDAFGGEGRTKDLERYCAVITAQPCSGTESDLWIPVKSFRWQVPDCGVRLSELESDPGRAAFFCLADAEDKFRAFRIRASVDGGANVLGRASEWETMPYDFNAYLSCIVLSPIDSIAHNKQRAVDFVNGAWRTDPSCGYSAALTLSLTAALRKRFGGLLFYSTLTAFLTEGRSGGVGDVVVWIVEPEDSGRAVSKMMKAIISKEAEIRRGIFEDALTLLKGLRPGDLAALRAAAQAAFFEDSLTEDDLALAIAALEKVLSKEPAKKKEETSAEGQYPARRYSISYTPEEREFDDLIVAGIGNFDEEIDVSKFVRPKSEGGYAWPIKKMWDTFFDVLWNNPQLFYVSKRGRYQYWTRADGTVTRAVLKDFFYGIDKSQYARCKQELEVAVARAMTRIVGIGDPVQKAKILHDHIISVCDYDRVACANHDSSPTARTVYSVLVRGSAVCEGYCMAYRYLLNKAGIVSEEIESDPMNHCWNYVLLNGRWYHVDVTWDDDGGRNPASHAYFLLSDEAIRDRNGQRHYGWTTRGLPSASDTWYDNYDWNRVADVDEKKKKEGVEKTGTATVVEDPFETYRNHVAFRARNRGCSLSCRGKIVIRVFFVDDADSAWDASAKEGFKQIVSSAADCLVRGAQEENLRIEVVSAYSDRKVARAVTSGGSSRQWISEVFGMTYSSELVDDQNRFRRAIGCDESPIVFAFNKDFRSCARTSESGAVGRRDDFEWSMVSYRPGDGVENVKRTLVHELLHQFGAIDLYYPKRVSEAADECLNGSVMRSGTKIDDLTKVLIGWRTTLSPKAIKFLEATKDITEKQIENALEQEWKKKWRG